MRISDWSSDVCSSDLERSRHLLEERLFFGVEKGHFDPSSFGPAPLRTRQFQYPFCNDVELHLASAALDRKALAAQPQPRIGHAAPPRRVPRQSFRADGGHQQLLLALAEFAAGELHHR